MLVITRRPEQSFTIDGITTVRVLEVRGDCVRIGIAAPPGLEIARDDMVNGKKPTEGESA